MNGRGIGVLAAMAMMGGLSGLPARKPLVLDGEERDDWELQEEYERIQRKESKLGRADRARVVYRWERLVEMRRAAEGGV